jgi:hypothetical protein
MKRSKAVKLSLALVIAFVFLGCVFYANAWSRRTTVKYRPLSHYMKNNPSVFYWWYGPAPNYEYRLDLAEFLPFGEGTPPPKGTYDGYIEERELPDGRAEITVYLHLHDAPFWLKSSSDPDKLIMQGMIDWYFGVEKFIIQRPGAEIPFILEIPYPDDYLSIYGSGMGHGIFTSFAEDFGFTPGTEGTFYLFQYGEGFYWPYEILDVYEL